MASLLPKSTYRISPLPFATPARCMSLPPVSLVEAVQAAVQQIEEGRLRPVVARTGSLAFQPRFMLAILSYCYAQEVYSSLKIYDCISRDEAFRVTCRSEFSSARELQSFRKQNRATIEKCLALVLHYLAGQKVAQDFVTRVHDSFVAEEAKRRIIMAACVDSMELENENQQLAEIV